MLLLLSVVILPVLLRLDLPADFASPPTRGMHVHVRLTARDRPEHISQALRIDPLISRPRAGPRADHVLRRKRAADRASRRRTRPRLGAWRAIAAKAPHCSPVDPGSAGGNVREEGRSRQIGHRDGENTGPRA